MDNTNDNGRNRTINAVIAETEEAIRQQQKAEEAGEVAHHVVIARMLDLYHHTIENAGEWKEACSAKGIRITGRTENPLTPIVKYFYPRDEIRKKRVQSAGMRPWFGSFTRRTSRPRTP